MAQLVAITIQPVPPYLREIIRYELELDYINDEILASDYGISLRTLQWIRKTWKEWDIVYVPLIGNIPRLKRIISDYYQEELLVYLDP